MAIELEINKFLKHAGLNVVGSTMTVEQTSNGHLISISKELRFSDEMRGGAFASRLNSFFGSLYESIKASPLVNQIIQAKQAELEIAYENIKALTKQVEELKQFKTHYEIEMKLRHGEKQNESPSNR